MASTVSRRGLRRAALGACRHVCLCSVHSGPQDENDETEERLYEREAQKREVAASAPDQPFEAEQQEACDDGDEEKAGDVVAVRDAATDEAGRKEVPREAGKEHDSHKPETSWARSGGGSSSGGARASVHVHSRSFLEAGSVRARGVSAAAKRRRLRS